MAGLLCLTFFVSGAAALVFETLWFRQAGLALGNSVWASSLVLAGFMAGLALGNALAARIGDRVRQPVRVFAGLELLIGLTGVSLVFLLPALGPLLAPLLRPLLDQGWILNPLRLAIAFALLLVPSTAMGATLPLLTRTLAAVDPNFGRVLGRLYGWNTLGAVSGALGAELVLVGALGIRGSAFAAACLNLLAAGLGLWISTRAGARPAPAPAASGRVSLSPAAASWLAAAFASGFAVLALEVVWFRFLQLYMVGTAKIFAAMLAVVLAGIALGGLAGSRWLRAAPGASRWSATVALAAGIACTLSYLGFGIVLTLLAPSPVALPLGVATLMLPVSLLSGVLFTLCGAGLRAEVPLDAGAAGRLTLANTVGAALGSLAGGFVLLPGLGMERSFFALAVVYGGLGALLFLTQATPRRAGLAFATAFALAAALFPFGTLESFHVRNVVDRWDVGGQRRIAALREGLTETVIYVETRMFGEPWSYELITNSYSMSSSDWASRRFMKLYVYLPMAVKPDTKNALLISYGVGSTAKALSDTKSLERVDVVDISRDILELSRVVYPDMAENPLRDPRFRVHVEDGRYFLQTTDRQFDLITADPPPPAAAGVVNLYTREYFALIRDRLADGGITTYWLPTHSVNDRSSKAVLRGFCDVFADCSLWNGLRGSLIMVGTKNARGPAPLEAFTRQWRDPEVAPELETLGFERPEQLGALFLGGAAFLDEITRGAAPLTDDHPNRIVQPPEDASLAWIRGWIDAGAARKRFQSSPLIARLWPEALRAATLPYFEIQDIINRWDYGTEGPRPPQIADLHALLSRSDLRAPVYWLMGTDADRQKIVAATDAAARADPEIQAHLAIQSLAERNPAEAAEHFRRAQRDPGRQGRSRQLEAYALSLAGDLDAARRIARASGGGRAARPFWRWMKREFGIGPQG